MRRYLIILILIFSLKLFPYWTLGDTISFGGQVISLDGFQVKERIEREVLWYSKDRAGYLHKLFYDLEFYKDIIYKIFDEYEIDRDYIYVAAVESSFDFRRVSTRKASGPWQFLKSTGKMYGLVINRYVDERNHPIKSTEAFCEHIKKLEERYEGDIVKVLSAYNSGERALNESLMKQNCETFWDCVSNGETSRYFTKILALKLIHKNSKEYGIEVPKLEKGYSSLYEPYSFKLEERIPFTAFCSILEISYREFYLMNPHLKHKGYRRGGVLNKGVAYNLFIPKKSRSFLDKFLKKEDLKTGKDTLVVDINNRSIGEIAIAYGKNWRDIAKDNNLDIFTKKSGLETVDLSKRNSLIIVR